MEQRIKALEDRLKAQGVVIETVEKNLINNCADLQRQISEIEKELDNRE